MKRFVVERVAGDAGGPLDASSEERLAAALKEATLIEKATTANGRAAAERLESRNIQGTQGRMRRDMDDPAASRTKIDAVKDRLRLSVQGGFSRPPLS